jgi:hypothetical protein
MWRKTEEWSWRGREGGEREVSKVRSKANVNSLENKNFLSEFYFLRNSKSNFFLEIRNLKILNNQGHPFLYKTFDELKMCKRNFYKREPKKKSFNNISFIFSFSYVTHFLKVCFVDFHWYLEFENIV